MKFIYLLIAFNSALPAKNGIVEAQSVVKKLSKVIPDVILPHPSSSLNSIEKAVVSKNAAKILAPLLPISEKGLADTGATAHGIRPDLSLKHILNVPAAGAVQINSESAIKGRAQRQSTQKGGNVPLQNALQHANKARETTPALNLVSPRLAKAFQARRAARINRLMVQSKTFGRGLREFEHKMLSGVIKLQKHAKTPAEVEIAAKKLAQYEELFANRELTPRESLYLRFAIERDLSAADSFRVKMRKEFPVLKNL
jgi:hypothetical protein